MATHHTTDQHTLQYRRSGRWYETTYGDRAAADDAVQYLIESGMADTIHLTGPDTTTTYHVTANSVTIVEG